MKLPADAVHAAQGVGRAIGSEINDEVLPTVRSVFVSSPRHVGSAQANCLWHRFTGQYTATFCGYQRLRCSRFFSIYEWKKWKEWISIINATKWILQQKDATFWFFWCQLLILPIDWARKAMDNISWCCYGSFKHRQRFYRLCDQRHLSKGLRNFKLSFYKKSVRKRQNQYKFKKSNFQF